MVKFFPEYNAALRKVIQTLGRHCDCSCTLFLQLKAYHGLRTLQYRFNLHYVNTD